MMLRAGLLYFMIVFAFAFAFGAVRTFLLEPRLGETMAVAMETPFLIAVMYFVARYVTRRFPLRARGLVGAGLIALALQQVAELALVYANGQGVRTYLAHFTTPPGMIFLAALIVFTLMPLVVGRKTK